MENIVKSLKAFLYDRSSNPFFANFLFAWSVTNWEIIYVTLFVDAFEFEPLTKLQFIEREYINWYDNALWPLLGALFLTLLFPLFFNKIVIPITERYSSERAALRLKARKEKPYSKEKANDLIDELNKSKTKYVDLLQELEDSKKVNISLQEEASEKINELNELNIKIKNSSDQLDRMKKINGLLKDDLDKSEKRKKELENLNKKLNTQHNGIQSFVNSNAAKSTLLMVKNNGEVESSQIKMQDLRLLDRAGLVEKNNSGNFTSVYLSPFGTDIANLLLEKHG